MVYTVAQLIFGFLLILSSLGVILARKPVYSALFFLLTLLLLTAHFLELSAEFIAVMQVLVYAGAILVMFMFVIVLFQDAHTQMENLEPKSSPYLLAAAAGVLFLTFGYIGSHLTGLVPHSNNLPSGFGSVESIGKALYLEFFFPFEATTLLFLIAAIGALFMARKNAS